MFTATNPVAILSDHTKAIISLKMAFNDFDIQFSKLENLNYVEDEQKLNAVRRILNELLETAVDADIDRATEAKQAETNGGN